MELEFLNLPDDRIYLSPEELAANTGRKIEDITAFAYKMYLQWTGTQEQMNRGAII